MSPQVFGSLPNAIGAVINDHNAAVIQLMAAIAAELEQG